LIFCFAIFSLSARTTTPEKSLLLFYQPLNIIQRFLFSMRYCGQLYFCADSRAERVSIMCGCRF
jgi:hypothetical protein